jgi:hypothetical protein
MSTSAAAGCNGVATQGLRTGAWSRASLIPGHARSVLPLTCRKENVWPSLSLANTHTHTHAWPAGWLAAGCGTHTLARRVQRECGQTYMYRAAASPTYIICSRLHPPLGTPTPADVNGSPLAHFITLLKLNMLPNVFKIN